VSRNTKQILSAALYSRRFEAMPPLREVTSVHASELDFNKAV